MDLAGKDPKDSDDFDRELRNSSNFLPVANAICSS
jgi:hypothetical protein